MRRLLYAVLVPVVALLGIRAFVAEPFRIPTGSMTPTLQPGDHVLANKLAYRLGDPRAGDIAIFGDPRGGGLLVKRVVAVGGQTVAIEDGVLVVDGRPRREAFVDYDRVDGFYYRAVRVPRDAVFVLGDERGGSDGSFDFGPVARDRLIGRVEALVLPPGRAGVL
jgi:signal peptidase I